MNVYLAPARYSGGARVASYFDRLLAGLRGVEQAGIEARSGIWKTAQLHRGASAGAVGTLNDEGQVTMRQFTSWRSKLT